jgi:hypothetical protein
MTPSDDRDESEPEPQTPPQLPEPYMPVSVTDQAPPDDESDDES